MKMISIAKDLLRMIESLEKENEKLREEKKRLESKVRSLEMLNSEYKKALKKGDE